MGCAHSKVVQGVVEPKLPGDAGDRNNSRRTETFEDSTASLPSDYGSSILDAAHIHPPPHKLADHKPSSDVPSIQELPELPWKTTNKSGKLIDFNHTLEEIERTVNAMMGTALTLAGIFDTTKLWYRSGSGALTPGLDRSSTFCQAFSETAGFHRPEGLFIITNAAEDPRFSSHPSVLHRPFARSYAGVPLLSFNGHTMGTFATLDTNPHDPPTPEQQAKLHELSTKVVSVFQSDVLEFCTLPKLDTNIQNISTINIELPSVWVDISTPDWHVVGVNSEWEDLTGINVELLSQFSGLLSVLAPEDMNELEQLKSAVETKSTATNNGDESNPLPSIMTPYYSSNQGTTQFILALRPAARIPPVQPKTTKISSINNKIWMTEVHGRVVSHPTYNPVRASASSGTSTEDRQLSGSGGGTAGSVVSGGYTTTGGYTRVANPTVTSGATLTTGNYSSGSPSDTYSTMPSRLSISGDGEVIVPHRLSSLQLGQLLGKGSYGSVFAGVLRGIPVAVKIIAIPQKASGQQLWEAQYEALVALQKRHQNVVPTLDWIKDENSNQVWIVQELCDLGTVASQFKSGLFIGEDGQLKRKTVLETALDVAKGMAYLHSLGVLHGDLSSNNVMLSSTDENDRGFVGKVIDFGLSRICSGGEITTKTVGTVSHMAPELLVEGIMAKSSDVYSFGIVLWEMWCGKRAWEGTSMGQVIFNVTVRSARLQLTEDAPPEFIKLTEDCVNANRDERPEFAEIVDRLQQILASES